MAGSVSVAMCTYNGGRWVGQQLTSILAQTCRPIEVVICDDRSTDNTADEVRRVAATSPVPVRYIVNEQNLGISRNFQKAMSLCQGDYIALSDQDDWWHTEKLAVLADALDRNPVAAYAFCDARLVDQNLKPFGFGLWEFHDLTPSRQRILEGDDAMELLSVANFATGATMLFRRTWLDDIMPVSPAWIHDGWIALMLSAFSRCVLVNRPLVDYRQHPAQKVGACRRDRLGQLKWQRIMNRDFFAREAPRWLAAWQFMSERSRLMRRRSDLELVRRRAMLDRDRLQLRIEPETRWDCVAQHAIRGDYGRYAWGAMSAAVDLLLHE